jgi:hypothetical protein
MRRLLFALAGVSILVAGQSLAQEPDHSAHHLPPSAAAASGAASETLSGTQQGQPASGQMMEHCRAMMDAHSAGPHEQGSVSPGAGTGGHMMAPAQMEEMHRACMAMHQTDPGASPPPAPQGPPAR